MQKFLIEKSQSKYSTLLLPMTSTQKSLKQSEKDINSTSITYRFLTNNGTRQSLKFLANLKSLFSKHLPKMPKVYISRLVFDLTHQCLIAIDTCSSAIIGGICFKVFTSQGFTQLAFLAVNTARQSKGVGSTLINMLKQQMQKREIEYILTYADNTAVGFFRKQGFSKQCQMSRNRWQGYIKNYEGGVTMECRISQKVNYSQIKEVIKKQKIKLIQTINSFPWTTQSYPLKNAFREIQPYVRIDSQGKKYQFKMNPLSIPGILESGWTWEQYQSMNNSLTIQDILECQEIIDKLKKQPLIRSFVEITKESIGWGSQEFTKEPLDLKTVQKKLASNKYKNLLEFCEDIIGIFEGCRELNQTDTRLYNYSLELEHFIKPFLENILEKGKFSRQILRNTRNARKNQREFSQ